MLLWLWVRFCTELKQTVLNSWCVKALGVKTGANPGGAIAPHKTMAIAPPEIKAIAPP